MLVDRVLDEAIRDGIYLYVEGNKLKYAATKNALSGQLKRKLEERKDEIIDRLTHDGPRSEEDASLLAEIPARDERSASPLLLSFGQQRLWFFHQYSGPNAVYNLPMALRLRGKVDEAALVRSLEELHRRHEALRTRFENRDGSAVQVIDPPGLELEVEAVSAAEAKVIGRAERHYYFDLSSERLCRIRLLRETASERGDAGDYVLLVTMHHSISDGWSLGIFFRELVSVYRAYTNGESSPLAPLPIQYADYAQWQRCWLQGAVLERQLSYWREQLEGLPPLLTLPTDRPRPAEQTFRGSTERLALPAGLTQRLQAVSREQGVTLYMTLLSAFAVLLGRYSGQQDVAVGTPIANRTRRETEGLIGFFVNTLVMRHDLSGDPRFVDLLEHTREVALQAYAHQDIPFEQLVEELNPQRSLSHSPLFQVAFALQNVPFEALELSGLTVRPFDGEQAEEEREGAPGGTARFDLTLNVQESAAGLVGGVEYNTDLFERGTIRRLLGHYERLLEAVVAAPQARLSRLEMLGEEERHRQLVEWNARSLDYPRDKSVHELFEEEANRSPEAIAVVDEDRRLTYRELNERANRLAHCLIEQGVAPGDPVGLCVDRDAERAVGVLGILKAGGAYVALDPDYPAERVEYLLEDSGVELIVTQSSVQSRLELQGGVESCGRRWVELEAEGALQGYRSTNPGVAVSAAALACLRYEADHAGVPVGRMGSHVGVLEGSMSGGRASAGEWMASLWAWPTRGASRYVLDRDGEVLPVGAVGELYIGGEGVGWGYRQRAGLTAERFVPNAFSAVAGERWYRTGERARWRVEGTLELVGRAQEAWRSRGTREERIQIERALSSHEGVREAVVVAFDAVQGQPRLAAYVVERAPGSIAAERFIAQLKAHLRTQPMFCPLPDEWRVLESLPRTAAGAVDRSALPQPEGRDAGLEYVAPRTELEKTLVEVWQERLGIERVGIEDNYFALGGDSIRSISLVAEARKRGVRFSVKDLFAYPTVSGLASAVERGEVRSDVDVEEEIEPFALLTERERERLGQRHDREAVEDAYPLSLMQQGMVLESLRHPGVSVYQNAHFYQFNDAWDPPLFERALRHLIARHPLLRSIHASSGERPLQLVLKEHAPELKVVDVRDLDKTAVQTALRQWTERETLKPLEASSSLWRLTIYVLSEQSFIFGMFIHHAQWDGWSLESFATELYASYGLLKREGRVAEHRPLPSYNRFIALEQSAIASKAHREYWTQKLEEATVPWWTGREKSASALIGCEISAQTSHKLSELARSLGVQEKSVWCSVYLALLSLLSGTDEAVGTVMTQGRPEIPDGDKIIGVFLNALPIRVRTSGRRWADLITETDRELREQHAFRHYPLAEIQRLTGLDFAAAMFNYSNWHVYYEGVDREGTREEWIPRKVGGQQETNYLLSVFVQKDDKTQRYEMGIKADALVFDVAFRERIRGYVANIVDAIARDATGIIEKTALLSDAERQQQLLEWNATARAYPHDKCIHELFEERARQRPEAVALVHEGRELTYGELNRCANRLARRLIERGVGPEVRVGLCMERSAEMVIGILGILKAGGCYVPLDPSYPRKRLEYLLEDAEIGILVTEASVAMRVAGPGRDLLLVNEASPPMPSGMLEDVDRKGLGLCPEHPAYLIYTSASTGAPKGVLGLHRSIVNRVSWLAGSLGADEVLCQKTSVGFVDHVAEIFQALSAGVPLLIVSPSELQAPRKLLRTLDARRVTRMTLVPSLLKTVLEAAEGEAARWLKSIHSSGEALHLSGLERFEGCFPQARLFNIYGSTEMGADVTCQEVEVEDLQAESARLWAPIGKGIDNAQAYVLDADGQMTVSGAVGELHVGGVCLSRGYFKRAGLTAQRFVPHPFSREPGERVYRTGDLARWLPDGNLEFLGRADHQVKVRGFRIELGEIESVLLAQDGVRDAVVVAREESSGDKRLVGYVVAEAGVQADQAALVTALRGRLQEQLPGYMVPSALMVLPSLPLTANGKLDRQALPAPEESTAEAEHTPPEGVTEEVLAELWCALLKRERVGRHDGFFALGGHSLLAMQLASRIRETFSTELPVRELFEHSTLSSQAGAIERARGAGAPAGIALEAVSREQPLPLSYAQERLWFLHQYMGPNAVYNMPLGLRLRGELDEAALVRSLEELHRRHEALRTRFENRDGSAVQVIDPPGLELEVEAVSAAEAKVIGRAERHYYFDLSSERLCRIRLLRETASERGDAGDYVLLVTMHHSISDGWSLGIFFRELVSVYRAYTNGESSPLAPLPIQYADYAQWQRRWLQGAVLERQLSYWREQLEGLPPLLTLPTDRPRPAEQTFRGSTERLALPAGLTQRLQAVSREQGVTLYMTLLSAFAVLLGRYSGQQDVAVGTPIANRTRRETEGLIGFFVNTLVMRHDLSGDPRFVDLLEHTREVALQAYAHQDIPFEQLVEELNPQRSLSHSPLFQVAFALQNVPFEALELSGLTVRPFDGEQAEEEREGAPEGTARFDLTLSVQESAAGLVGGVEYNTDLFERGTIRRLLGHYERLLEAVVAAPQARLSRLEMLGEEEQRRLLLEWNATARAYPHDECIHELFEEQARLRPDAVAVVHEGSELSYGELNRRANQLAHCLRDQGVGSEARVGICMKRSPEMVVGLLGILKAGGAYVPLDPEYPAARLEYMLAQSGCRVVLSTQHLLADLPLLSTTKVLSLDGGLHDALFSAYSDANVEVEDSGVCPSNLAYVIYTSGSTGQPKGSAIVHRSISRLIYNDFVDYASMRTILCAASPSFDAFTFELWGALLHGGRSVMGGSAHASFSELGSVVDRQGVDCAWLTSSLFNQLIVDSAGSLRSLKRLLVGGEALSIGHIREALRQLPQTMLINGYGPTENTTFSCTYAIAEEELSGRSSVPIGRPIGNTRAYVLGPRGEVVPTGVVGELYLGGAGLARGYLGQAGLTAEKFVPSAFAQTPGERLYRTGDLVRYLPEGSLEFIGRVDHQVKVRGFRIELGEIESVLLAQDGVRDAVVVVREEEAGSKRLVGYVVAEAGAQADDVGLANALRSRLQEQLPSYMVPSALMVLPSLPLTANGKLDRQALPAPSVSSRQVFVPPASEVERWLCEIWQAVLGSERIGVEDNFFAAGGDSILSIQVVSQAKARGLRLTVRELFKHPTIRALAKQTDVAEAEVAQAAPESSDGEMPLLPIHRRLLESGAPRPQHYHQSQLLNVPEGFSLEFLRGFVAALYRRHDALRLRYRREEERWHGHFAPVDEELISRTVVEQRLRGTSATSREAERLRSAQAVKAGFDLERGPLLKAVYFKGARAEDSSLLLVLHHLVVDGVSWRILLEDLSQAFEQWRSGDAIDLAPKTTSYQRWGTLLLEHAGSAAVREEKEYWVRQLSQPVPPLPLDHEGEAAVTQEEVEHTVIALRREETEALLTRCGQAYRAQIQELLLASLLLAFHDWTGQRRLRVNVEGHGREEGAFAGVDLSETVGWFTSLYPVCLELPDGEENEEALLVEAVKSVKEHLRRVPQHGLNYGVLRYLADDEELRGLGLAHRVPVLFNYLGQFDQHLGERAKFAPARGDKGRDVDGGHPREHLLELNGGVSGGCLRFVLDYHPRRHRRETVERLGSRYAQGLRRLIRHSQAPGLAAYTPTDFPLVFRTNHGV